MVVDNRECVCGHKAQDHLIIGGCQECPTLGLKSACSGFSEKTIKVAESLLNEMRLKNKERGILIAFFACIQVAVSKFAEGSGWAAMVWEVRNQLERTQKQLDTIRENIK